MTVRYGLNVGGGPVPAAELLAVGATVARRVVYLDQLEETREWAMESRAVGVQPLLLLASEVLTDNPLLWQARLAEARHYLAGIGAWLQVGNEPDAHWAPDTRKPAAQRRAENPGSPSWMLDQVDLQRLLSISYAALAGETLVTPGFSSGHPSYLDGLDLTGYALLAYHPYGKWVSRDSGTGLLRPLHEGHLAYAQRTGARLIISEIGWQSKPEDPSGMSEDEQAEYLTDVLGGVRGWADLEAIVWFCYGRYGGFGLLREAGSRKPSYEAFRRVALQQPQEGPVAPILADFRFVLGFETVAKSAPELVGLPLEDEWGPAPNCSFQRTTDGLLFWAMLKPGDGGPGYQKTMGFVGDDGRRWLWRGDRLKEVDGDG